MLCADSIGKRFGDRDVLTAATLRAPAGTITLMLGQNGIGKSTLLTIAARYLGADHGAVTFKGHTYLRPRWHRLARAGHCFIPDREIRSPRVTVRQHLAAVARQFGSGDVEASAALFGATRHLDQLAVRLSPGERRRAELAIAALRSPDCLLADGPYRSIDPKDRELVSHGFRQLASIGCAVVVSGHEVPDLLAVADPVVWRTDGTTYELGAPAKQ